jgi:hypothetical protein
MHQDEINDEGTNADERFYHEQEKNDLDDASLVRRII